MKIQEPYQHLCRVNNNFLAEFLERACTGTTSHESAMLVMVPNLENSSYPMLLVATLDVEIVRCRLGMPKSVSMKNISARFLPLA